MNCPARTSVIMRSHNDMPLVRETLMGLQEQNVAFELIAFDNASRDGTRQELEKHAHRIVHVNEGSYRPGQILNRAMGMTHGELVVFLNSDCIPQNPYWLERLLAGFDGEQVAAVFGRQVPHPHCQPLFVKDLEDTYGEAHQQQKWRHCFSMAASAIRRSVWEDIPFNEGLRYSEDVDWTWRAHRRGYGIRYLKDAIVMHSHNYNPRQFYRRHLGEGRAEASIFPWSRWQRSLLRYTVLPYLHQVLTDWSYCANRGAYRAAAYSPFLRLAQAVGRRSGFRRGWAERKAS